MEVDRVQALALSSLATSLMTVVDTGQVQTFETRCAAIRAMIGGVSCSYPDYQQLSAQMLARQVISHEEYCRTVFLAQLWTLSNTNHHTPLLPGMDIISPTTRTATRGAPFLSSMATSLMTVVDTGQVQTFETRCAAIRAMIGGVCASFADYKQFSAQMLAWQVIAHQEYCCIMFLPQPPVSSQSNIHHPTLFAGLDILPSSTPRAIHWVPPFAGMGTPRAIMGAPSFAGSMGTPRAIEGVQGVQGVPSYAGIPACAPQSQLAPLQSQTMSWVGVLVVEAEQKMKKYRIRHDCNYWDSARQALESADSCFGTLGGAKLSSGGSNVIHYYKCRETECGLVFRVTQCAPKGQKQVWVVSQKSDLSGDCHSVTCNFSPSIQPIP
jgi:hypothetical protein